MLPPGQSYAKSTPVRNITLKQLRVVAAVARTGRITGAAELLGVTPPAVTLQLKDIEARLGMPLFERRRRGMQATDAGKALLDAAARIEDALRTAIEDIGALRGLLGGVVTVGVTSTAKYFAPAALGAFKRAHPDIVIELVVGNREEVIRALAGLEIDLAVMGQPPAGSETISTVIGDHPFVIVAPPDHPLAGRAGLAIAALADESFITREPGSGTRELMNRVFAGAGLAPRPGMTMASNETIKQAAMAGLGIAFISGHTIAAEVETGRLAVLDVSGLPARREWRVVRHADKRLMPAAEALWGFLVRDGHAFLPVLASRRPSKTALSSGPVAATGRGPRPETES